MLGGCSTFVFPPAETAVAERAQARIGYLMAGDYDSAYAYATPGYRSVENVGRYGTRWAGTNMWQSAEVQSVVCEGPSGDLDLCKVVMAVDYLAVKHGVNQTLLIEQWVLIDGQWYIYQDLGQ
jgi:hypothetical protein